MAHSEVQPAHLKPEAKGAEYIADFLIQQKVPYIFGVCGHGILGLLDGLFDRQNEIKTISVHHEAAAGFMAEAHRVVPDQQI
jgi:acetolactate synthase-1/2/3 large subunit